MPFYFSMVIRGNIISTSLCGCRPGTDSLWPHENRDPCLIRLDDFSQMGSDVIKRHTVRSCRLSVSQTDRNADCDCELLYALSQVAHGSWKACSKWKSLVWNMKRSFFCVLYFSVWSLDCCFYVFNNSLNIFETGGSQASHTLTLILFLSDWG